MEGRVTDAESTLTSSVQYNDNGAYTELLAGPNGSEITLSADQININGIARFINSSFARDFSADNFTDEWTAASGNTIGTRAGGQTEIGSASLQLSSTADMSSTSGGSTGGASIAIPAEIASAWSGRRIEIRLWIKKDANAYTYSGHELAVAYSTADVGNSNWRRFALTNDYRQVSFFYDVPAKNNPGGVDYLGILGDADGGGGHALVDKIEITAQPTVINGSQIETGSITADRLDVIDLNALQATIGGWRIYDDNIAADNNDLVLGSEFGIRLRATDSAGERNALTWLDVDSAGTLLAESYIQGRGADLFYATPDGGQFFRGKEFTFQPPADYGTSGSVRPIVRMLTGLSLQDLPTSATNAGPWEVWRDGTDLRIKLPDTQQPPTAYLAVSNKNNLNVTFDASNSYSEASAGLEYRFKLEDTDSYSAWQFEPEYTDSYPSAGTYTATVEVRDQSNNMTDTNSTTVSVTDPISGGGSNDENGSSIAF